MKYSLFSKLYKEALNNPDVEFFIEELGVKIWNKECKDTLEIDSVIRLLEKVHSLANGTLRDNRQLFSPTRSTFSRMYNVPLRTVENWESDSSPIPEHTKMLMDYTFFMNEEQYIIDDKEMKIMKMVSYKDLVVDDDTLYDEVNDINYILDAQGKVRFRVVYRNNDAKREAPYTDTNPAYNLSEEYTYKELYKKEITWY